MALLEEASKMLQVKGFDVLWNVSRFRGHEALSTPYRFDLIFAVPKTVDTSSLLDREAILSITAGRHERRVAGIFERVRHGVTLGSGERQIRARLVPRLSRLALRKNSRVFQDQPTSSVVARILGEYGVPIRSELTARYRVREICIQHEERDLDFVERLLAEEGIAYRFEAPPPEAAPWTAETLVLFDSAAYPDLESGPHLLYRPIVEGAALVRQENHVGRFEEELRKKPRSIICREHDFLHPDRTAARSAANGPPVAVDAVYEHHGPYGEMQTEPQPVAQLLEQHRRNASRQNGESESARLAPGFGIVIEDHDDVTLSAAFAVVTVEHFGTTKGDARSYRNVFHTVRREFLLRPARPDRRVRQSIETAMVCGPPGEDVHTDALGRIKLQFSWDLVGRRDDQSSCWVRVAQSWAGAGWGSQFIPRVGMEVLVAYLGGDPDRPIVVGALANATHPPAFPLPANKTRSGFRS